MRGRRLQFDFPFIVSAMKEMVKTIPLTLMMAVLPIVFGFLVALGNIIVRIFRIKGLVACSRFYVSFFRSTPAILHIMLIYLGIPPVADQVSSFFISAGPPMRYRSPCLSSWPCL